MKGVIRIGGAVVVGGCAILIALYMTNSKSYTAQGDDIRSGGNEALVRASLEENDTDGDGIPDWEELLRDKAFRTITSPTSSLATPKEEEYEPPTTLTGKFSEAFLQDYLTGKMSGEDFSDPSQFIQSAIDAIDASTGSKKHTRAELTIIPATKENMRTYGNELARIVSKGEQWTDIDALTILYTSLKENNPAILSELIPIKNTYADIIDHLVSLPVPDSLALHHIGLLNAYEATFASIHAMSLSFDDPLLTLSQLQTSDAVHIAPLKNILTLFDTEGIIFMDTEPATYFYKFDSL